jgi:transposase
MVTIGVDPHKQAHTAAAVIELGVDTGQLTAPARPVGNGQLLEWARALDAERVWAIEDVRNVSGSLERFLIDRAESPDRATGRPRARDPPAGHVSRAAARHAHPALQRGALAAARPLV